MHEREEPEGMRGMRDFYEWLLMPVKDAFNQLEAQLTGLRQEQAEFRNELRRHLSSQAKRSINMSVEMDRLTAVISRSVTVSEGFMAFSNDIIAKLRAAAENPTAINKLADDLEASTNKNAAAMVVNTEASGEPPLPPQPNAEPV